MNRKLASFLSMVAFSLAYACAQNDAPARAKHELDQGVAAYKSANYEAAVEHFSNAVRLDDGLTNARLYLAIAYAQQYIPGVDDDDNVKMAADAIEQFSEVSRRQPDNVLAVKWTAHLYMLRKRFEDAKQYYQRAVVLDPNDPESYYSVGVMDWMEVYRNLAEERAKMNFKSGQSFIFDVACRDIRAKNMPAIDEGMTMLTKAISLRKDYEDAMAYMNLLYRTRAELACGDPQTRKADEDKANDWADLAMATRQKKMEAAQAKGKKKVETPSGLVLHW